MNPRIDDWSGKRVWMIGASTGIGAAAAQQLLLLGAKVALSARNAEAIERAAAVSRNALGAPLDVTDHASVLRARDKIVDAWGGVDLVLVAHAHRPGVFDARTSVYSRRRTKMLPKFARSTWTGPRKCLAPTPEVPRK